MSRSSRLSKPIPGKDAGEAAIVSGGRLVGMGRKFTTDFGLEYRLIFRSKDQENYYLSFAPGRVAVIGNVDKENGHIYVKGIMNIKYYKNRVTGMAKLQRIREAKELDESSNQIATGKHRSGDSRAPRLAISIKQRKTVELERKEAKKEREEKEMSEKFKNPDF